jgi:hypothetical protein
MLSFPVSPTSGQQFRGWTWDGVKWSPTKLDRAPRCGILRLNGASPQNSLIFLPRNGDQIKINGLIYKIPSAGILGTANNCFLEGVGGSSLVYNVIYYIYAFMHATLGMQLDFSTTGHTTSVQAGNVGVEIKSGDNTRTLVGITWAAGNAPTSNTFYDNAASRMVRSWFNRRSDMLGVPQQSVVCDPTNGYAFFGVQFVALSDDNLKAEAQWWGTGGAWGNLACAMQLNSGTYGASIAVSTPYTVSQYKSIKAIGASVATEGRNQLNFVMSNVNAGQASGYGYLHAVLRC